MGRESVVTVQFNIDDRPRAVIPPADPVRLLRLLARHWLFLGTAAIAGFVAMLGVLMMVTPTYDVTAKILVRIGREMTAPPVLGVKEGAQIMPASKRPEDLASEVEIFSNPRLIRGVVEHFGADTFLAERTPETLWQHVKAVPKAAWRWVRENLRELTVLLGLRPQTTPIERVTLAIASGLTVEAVRKSDVIEIKLGFPDPEAGEAVLAKFIELGLQSHVEAHRNSGTKDFFAGESSAAGAELKLAERRLLQLRTDQDAAWSGPERRSLIIKTESELQLQLAQALVETAQAEAELKRATAALKGLQAEVQLSRVDARNKIGDDLRARLNQLQLEMVALRTRYAEGHPDVLELKGQIDALNASIDGEPSRHLEGVSVGPNQQHMALSRDIIVKENQLAGLAARAAELSAQLAKLREQLVASQTAEVEIAQAEREVARLRHSLERYERGLAEARIAEAMDTAEISNLKVIMPPTATILPTAPSLRRYLIIGVVGGLALAIAFLLLRNLLGRAAPEPQWAGAGGPRMPEHPAREETGPRQEDGARTA